MAGGEQRRESLGGTLLRWWGFASALFVGVNLLAIPVREARLLDDEPQLEPHVDAGIRASYPGLLEPERRQLARESFSRFEMEALAQQREAPRRGRFVNVSEHGFREVEEQGPWPPVDGFYNVFFFGGSTGFGYGVRDADTVASQLQQRLAEREGRPVRVYNFAHGGYNSVQERLALERLLALGYVPDLAVFLDGMNDFQAGRNGLFVTRAATRTLDASLRDPLREWLASLPVVRAIPPRLLGRQPKLEAPTSTPRSSPAAERRRYDDPRRHEAVIAAYRSNLRATRERARGLGFEALFVWQPVPNHHYDLRYHVFQGDFGSHGYARYGYPRMARRVAAGDVERELVWCADVQLGLAEPLYVDTVHYNPRLSGLVADCIRDAVADGRRPRPVVARPR